MVSDRLKSSSDTKKLKKIFFRIKMGEKEKLNSLFKIALIGLIDTGRPKIGEILKRMTNLNAPLKIVSNLSKYFTKIQNKFQQSTEHLETSLELLLVDFISCF